MHQELFYFFIEKVFASDPWHLAQPGSIRNLTIQTKGSKEIVNKNFANSETHFRVECLADYDRRAEQKDKGAKRRSGRCPAERSVNQQS